MNSSCMDGNLRTDARSTAYTFELADETDPHELMPDAQRNISMHSVKMKFKVADTTDPHDSSQSERMA